MNSEEREIRNIVEASRTNAHLEEVVHRVLNRQFSFEEIKHWYPEFC
jgi:hypothetical protein